MNYFSGMCAGARTAAKQDWRLASSQNGAILQEQKNFSESGVLTAWCLPPDAHLPDAQARAA